MKHNIPERTKKTRTVQKTSVFPSDKDKLFALLQKLETLQYIARPYATFTPLDKKREIIWKEGERPSFRFSLFGIIPLGIHRINVIRFDKENGIYTNEGNRLVPVWNHEIILEETDDRKCLYTDKVEIGAGWKTVFIWLWANLFYSHRQKKWKKLLKNPY